MCFCLLLDSFHYGICASQALDAEMSYSGPVNEFRRAPAIILEEGTGLVVTNSSFRQFTFLRMCDVGDPIESNMRWNVVFSVSQVSLFKCASFLQASRLVN